MPRHARTSVYMQYIPRQPHLAVRDHRCIFELRLLISGWRSDTTVLTGGSLQIRIRLYGTRRQQLARITYVCGWAAVWSPILVCCVFAGFAPGRYVGLHRQRRGVHGLVLPVVVGMYYDQGTCYC